MEIQPRSFGDSLSDLINMLGKVWRPLLLPALVTSVVVAVASVLVFNATDAFDFFDLALSDPEALEQLSESELFELFRDFFVAMLWLGVISMVAYGFLYLAASRAVGQAVSPEGVPGSISGFAIGHLLPWLIAAVLVAVGTFVGLIFLIVPGIWLAIAMAVFTQAMAIEDAGPIAAMRRSYELVKGNWWETFGFLLVVGLIGGTAAQMIQILAVPALFTGTNSLAFGLVVALGIAAQGLIMAGIAVGATVWYLNLRARTDGPYILHLS